MKPASLEPDAPGSERPWHALPAAEVLRAFGVEADAGLAAEEVALRLGRFGPNALPEPARRSLAALFLRQFASPLIFLLLGAAGLALALGKFSDGGVVLAVVLLNALIGSVQEGRAERALALLRQMAALKARALRGGRDQLVEARDIVPGDIVLLSAGDAVPADARVLDGSALQVAEAALTGESVPVSKDCAPVDERTPLADRRSMVYGGTHVTAGRARAVVVATGLATEVGRIAALAGAGHAPRTPLEQRIARFGRFVLKGAAVLFLLVVAVGWLRGLALEQVLMLAISQVVGMVPEGLPVALTIALAVGVQRMARRGAIVRRLSAVETLGSTTVICSDKTGTLTRNELTATAVFLAGRSEIQVSGVGYAPEGGFSENGRRLAPGSEPDLLALLEAGLLCNDARLVASATAPDRWQALGDPTEAALLTLARKGGCDPEALRERRPRRAEIPFDPATRLMATEHDGPGTRLTFLKGAPEAVLELCASVGRDGELRTLDAEAVAEVRAAAERMADRALRVLAIASADARLDSRGVAALRGRVTLLGLVGLIDPPRPEAARAVERCRTAGIRPVMVTGDHRSTGLAVARALGIAGEGDQALEGADLEELTDEELAARIERISVFARVQPAQKLRIVQALQRGGAVVAMTGDGVNDAPALVSADVGVAMGLTGTDVAKEAAKIVVTDDDFATIVAAVEEGRVVHGNIKKAILLLFTTALAEVAVLLLALCLGYPPPFAAVQILWNNLVTEGVITVNLIVEPAEGDEMQRPPVAPDEPLLARGALMRVAVMTLAIVASTLGWFVWRLSSGVPLAVAQTETFTLLAVCEWFNVLNCRSERRSALTLSLLRNPWLLGGLVAGNLLQVAVVYLPAMNALFHTVPFGLQPVLAIGAAGSLVLWAEEARKLASRSRGRRARA